MTAAVLIYRPAASAAALKKHERDKARHRLHLQRKARDRQLAVSR